MFYASFSSFSSLFLRVTWQPGNHIILIPYTRKTVTVDVTEGLDLLHDVQIRENVGTGVPIFFFVRQTGRWMFQYLF